MHDAANIFAMCYLIQIEVDVVSLTAICAQKDANFIEGKIFRQKFMINFKVAVRHLSGAGPSPSGGLVLFSKHGSVGLVKLNRPESLNSLSSVLFDELLTCLKKCDLDTSIGAIVLTGSEKAFAGSIFILNMGLAGADIKEMSERTFSKNINENFLGNWSEIQKIRKPIIAAVNGFAVSPAHLILVAWGWLRACHDVRYDICRVAGKIWSARNQTWHDSW